MKNVKLFDIDLHRLDELFLEQPKQYYIHADLLATARGRVQIAEAAVELAKTEMKETEARLTIKVHNTPSKFGLSEKPTVGSVAAAVMVCKSYKEAKGRYVQAQSELNNAWNEVNHIQAIVSALDQKKSALENLVRLHGQNYFSAPKVPANEKSRELIENAKKKKARMR